MSIPQSGIFALGTASHAYLEFEARSHETARLLVSAIASLREPRTTMGGVNLVAGFRPELWSEVGPGGVTVRRPRLTFARRQHDGRAFQRSIERGLERGADRNDNTGATLRLPQTDVLAVIGRPGQPQKIALPLTSPQREQQRQMQVRRCPFQERGLVIGGPNLVGA